jgi:hypothetical protein
MTKKLTEDKVKEIKEILFFMKNDALAITYGVSKSTIQSIRRGKTWGWVF